MSLDLLVACAVMPALPMALPDPSAWKKYEHDGHAWYAYETGHWQVLVSIAELDPDDLKTLNAPPSMPTIVSVVMEPSMAPDEGVAFLERTVDVLVKACNGALLEN